MNLPRRTLLACGLAQVTVSLIGCASEPAVRQRTYKEQVSTLLLSKDGKQLVILGAAHHYVFDAPTDLVALTQSALRSRVEARIEPFVVSREGQIDGAYSLHLPAGLSRAEAQAAKKPLRIRSPWRDRSDGPADQPFVVRLAGRGTYLPSGRAARGGHGADDATENSAEDVNEIFADLCLNLLRDDMRKLRPLLQA